MAKGEGVSAPMCKLCQEPHFREPGKVCPKFRSKKVIIQPEPLRLSPPPKPAAPDAAKRDKPKPKKRKKAKRAKKAAAPPPASAS